MYIDTHAHILSSFYKDIDDIVNLSKKEGVGRIVSIGTNISESIDCIEISRRYKGYIYPAIGLHPEIADNMEIEELEAEIKSFEMLLNDHKEELIALGEIGLDYHYGNIGSNKQKILLKNQINIAIKNNLPIIIHCREAFNDLIPILKNISDKYKGVIHSFDGTIEEAKTLINMGFFISFNGIITFKNADKIREVAKEIPIENILLETDSPFLSPVPVRGSENNPGNIKYTYEFVANLKEISLENLQKQMEINTKNLFGI